MNAEQDQIEAYAAKMQGRTCADRWCVRNGTAIGINKKGQVFWLCDTCPPDQIKYANTDDPLFVTTDGDPS